MTEKEFKETDFYEVKEYDSLQIAGIKFLWFSLGAFAGAFTSTFVTLFYIFH